MIWHILKKDWKLMWKATVAVASLQLAFALIQLKSELGHGNPVIQQFGILLMMLWLIASVILVVMLVQQDAIPGTKQDWLTRPIRRKDVVIAKIVFATLALQGATITGDVVQGLGSGFPLKQTLGAALSRAAIGFIAITLPALVLGALTQSIAEAMVMSVVLIGGAFLFTVMAIAIAGDTHQFDPTNMTGVEWIPNLIRYGLVLAGGLFVLTWQYRTRQTLRGRSAVAVISLVVLCSQVIPWTPVFAVEKGLSPEPGTANPVSIDWRDAEQNKASNQKINPSTHVPEASPGGPRLVLPLTINGLPTDAVLKEDKSQVVLLDASGRRLYHSEGDDLEIRHEDGTSGPDRFDQTVKIPASLVQEHENTPVQINATYSMTLFTLRSSYTMKAVNDDQMLAGWGRCRTKMDGTYTAIEMVCLQMGKGPTCATVFLEDPRDGSRNQVNTACYPNYSPYLERPIPDATTRFRLILPYRDPAGFTKFPVDASKLAGAQIRIRIYEPIDHITRVVTSPVLAMKELVVQ
jgi:hypothetical protein